MAFDVLQDAQKQWAYERFGDGILADGRCDLCSNKENFILAGMEEKGWEIAGLALGVIVLLGRNKVVGCFFDHTSHGAVIYRNAADAR
jgi:hypothetical protein